MDKQKRNLKGSEKRDVFKRRHKDLRGSFYATDADFCLVSKKPPGTVAYLDYKASYDSVTFAEVIQYNEWRNHAPVFIFEGDDPENGPFIVYRYLGGNWKPEPPEIELERITELEDWRAVERWEANLRSEYRRRGGWDGNLRIAA
jgi:hypothetical protein